MTVTLFVLAAVAAVGDWIAVGQRLFRLEYVLKPLTLALLMGAAAGGDLGDAQLFLVLALLLSLVGDVALMLAAARGAGRAFFVGLIAFVLGHGAYIVTFLITGVHPLPLISGALIAVGVGGLALPAVLQVLGGRTRLAVAGYSIVVAVMATLAAGTQQLTAALGGALFVVSDAVLARERFLDAERRVPWPPGVRYSHTRAEVVVAVTYHLAQLGIVGGLLFATG